MPELTMDGTGPRDTGHNTNHLRILNNVTFDPLDPNARTSADPNRWILLAMGTKYNNNDPMAFDSVTLKGNARWSAAGLIFRCWRSKCRR